VFTVPTTTSNVLGIQKEKVLNNLPKLFLGGESKVITEIMRNGGLGAVAVSKRALRIPLQTSMGGNGRIVSFDGGPLGRGSSIGTTPGFVSTIGLVWAVESTTEAYWGTEGSDRATASLHALEQAQEMENFKQFLDSLFFAPNGSPGVVLAITGNTITVQNANNFYSGQGILFYTALGGTVRSATTSTVMAVDANNKQITLSAAPPGGTVVGDVIFVDGSPGTAGSSIASLYDYHVSTNTGTILTLARSAFPGQLNANGYAAGGSALTPVMVRLILQLSIRKIGTKNTAYLNSMKFIVGVEQAAAWEAAGMAISQIFRNIPLGKSMFDPLSGTTPDTMAGRELITQLHGDPTRVDSVVFKNWGMATTKAIGPYTPPGSSASVFPVVSVTDGSVVASNLKYWALEANPFCINPAQESFISGLALPAGL
jgi:hypothetical protein